MSGAAERGAMELTRENYYSIEANRAYMSNSQWGDWQKCEAAARAQHVIGGDPDRPGTVTDAGGYCPPDKDYFVLGRWMHEMVLQSPGWRQAADDLSHLTLGRSGVMRLKKGDWNQSGELCQRMLKRWQQETDLHGLLAGEKEVMLTGSIAGIPWRCAIDSLDVPRRLVGDLKTPRSVAADWVNTRLDSWADGSPKRVKVPWYEVHNYPRQLAGVYRYMAWLHTGEWLDPTIVAIVKYPEPVVRAYGWSEEQVKARGEWELERIKERMPRVVAVRDGDAEPTRCGECQYCRITDRSYGDVMVDELAEVAP